MRVAILTAGSQGDVQPYVALGAGLRGAGFTVRLATHVGFRDLAEAHGLEFSPVAHPSSALTADPRWSELQSAGDSPARFVQRTLRISRMLAPLLAEMLDGHWRACDGADAVISSVSAFAGPQQAAALGVPHCWALLQPMTPTSAYPHFMTPARLRLPGRLNRETHILAERVHHRLFGAAVDRWVVARLGVPPPRRPPRGGLFGARAGPILYGISPTLLPVPDDAPPNVAQVGDWHLEAPPHRDLPPEVCAFLAAGPPPVFVHTSRIASDAGGGFAAIVLRVLRRLGLRGLFSEALPDQDTMTDSALAVPPVPFDRLFGDVAAVVHHGGAGTTAASLRAGAPSLGIPGFFDQPFWSTRVAALGAGPGPIPARRVTEARLQAALAELVGRPVLRRRAAELGRRMSAEHGVEDAVAHLRGVLTERDA